MRIVNQGIFLLLITVLFSSCATLLGKTRYPVRINSVPTETIVTIYNRKGIEVFSDTTPCVAKLKSNAGYFRRAIYTVEFNRTGYARSTEVVRAKVNPFYYGNILFGGYVGFLLIDPITGAMYQIPTKEINQVLAPDRQGEPIRM